jgi:phosphate transport system permease protein
LNRWADRVFVLFCWAAAISVSLVICIFLGFLVYRGAGALNEALFFGDTPPWQAFIGRLPVWDGIWPACVGTLSLVLLSCSFAVPLGIASGIYLAEYASGRWKALSVLAVDLLAGLPSIVMGLFGFALILLLRKTILPTANTCLLLSAVCIALLVVPYLIRTTQTALESLDEPVRLVGPSLGLTHWQNVAHVLLPAAGRGMLSGVILAVGRAAEDTAVILLTGVVANAGMPQGISGKFEALPFTIYYLAAEHRTPEDLQRGFGAAIVLLCLTGLLFLAAQLIRRSLRRAWT